MVRHLDARREIIPLAHKDIVVKICKDIFFSLAPGAIATWLKAIAVRMDAIAIRVEAMATYGWRGPKHTKPNGSNTQNRTSPHRNHSMLL